MKSKYLASLTLAATFSFVQPVAASLPMLDEPWLGYFAVANESDFRFLFSSAGEFNILVVNENGDAIEQYPITLHFLARETLPDASMRDLTIKWETVESSDPPTAKLKKTIFRSKLTEEATGQPTLEVTIEISGGSILASARITDKGAFDKNPLQPVIRVVFPGFYAPKQAAMLEWDKKQIKDFDKLIGKDSVRMKQIDGKTVKLACIDKMELTPAQINAARTSLIEVEIGAYQNRKIEFIAAPNSSLTLGNAGATPLHAGFRLQWSVDAANDPDGNAKLAIRIK